MSGFVYAFGSALFASTSDALSKKALQNHSTLVTAWVRLAYATPFLLPFFCVVDVPRLDKTFWTIIVSLIPLEIVAIILYMKALQISPLSLTIPFLALTPVFSIVTSFLMLGELPGLWGTSGIFLIVFGAYFLNVNLSKKGMLEPLRAIMDERGSVFMIGVAFIYSITSNLGKLAVQHSSPLFMALFYLPFLSLTLLPLAVQRGMRFQDLRSGGSLFLLIGVSQALMTVCHFKAVAMILVPYMISVKRLSLLMSVGFGRIFFHEEHIRERLFGSILMLLGVVLIVL
jgi:drug/metabolite transporter (DMT)-like permease